MSHKPVKRTKRVVPDPGPEAVFISAPQLQERYGGRSRMWIKRQLENDETFPSPVYFGPHRYWRIADLVKWERASAAKSRAA